jgi:hypothetical protein
MAAILNLSDEDFAKDPFITDRALDKLEAFVEDNNLSGPSIINVFTPSFDVADRITKSERPRRVSTVSHWSPSLYPIS